MRPLKVRNMRRSFQVIRAAAVLGSVLFGPAMPAALAQSASDFYKGKVVAIVMGTGPGGSYDLYGRIIAAHLGRMIPGNPKVIIEQMPGAGGIIAGNYIFNTGPQDGTKILMSHPLPLIEKLEPNQGVRYESAKFQWLGTYDSINQVMALWHTAPALSLADPKAKSLVLGSFNKTHLSYQWAMMAKNVLGASYKVITGYPSGNHLDLAMERGEISGWVVAWENLTGTKPDWLAEKKVVLPMQFAPARMSDLPDVPTLGELAPADKKDIVDFVVSGTPFSRALAVGPQVPADRVAVLRRAFDDLMRDEAFLADAAKLKLGIEPRNAEQVQAMVNKIVGATPELVTRVKQAIGQE
jgi:tripartite-type tricarboxylate transporter receptor subunit TctC